MINKNFFISRRRFLKTTGLLTATTSVPSSVNYRDGPYFIVDINVFK